MGLLDDISKLTQPAAELPDLEDDNLDGNSVLKSMKKSKNGFDFEQDKKYAGKAVSRAELFGDISEISGIRGKNDEEDVEDGDVDDEEDVEDEEDADDVAMDSEDVDDDGEEDEEEEDVDDEEDGEEDEDDVNEDSEDVAENLKMKLMSLKDDGDKTDKATAVRNQKLVWDDLMYSNIRIHALLNVANQMPRGDVRKNLLKGADEKTKTSLEKALANLGKLRSEMRKAVESFGNEAKEDEDDDEEIPSDDEILPSEDEEDVEDEEGDSEDVEEEEDVKKETGTSVKALKKTLEKNDSGLEKFRTTTITKWYNRTKLLNNKSMNNTDFSVFEKGSIVGQIQKVLSDEEKLLKKVRTNRNNQSRIGGGTTSDEIDNEIFDDSDFYQILLKQMLEARNNQNSHQDGADMTRSYIELQSMFNQKKKRDVSQLSSKDRRLKYEPIAKLINFYPSKPSVVTWSHESRNELFKSLFT